MTVVVLDNYDSFTFNLVQYLEELAESVDVIRNDAVGVDELVERAGSGRLVISPGPGGPDEAGISVESVRAFAQAGLPVLGVCLGHQAIARAFGGVVGRHEPVHGKPATIAHDGETIFRGLDSPLEGCRYHSLVIQDPGDELECSAWADDVVMAVRHRRFPVDGIQFHPESILTPAGRTILHNFLERR